ncbi:sushi, nidogen and EGF-like domain-containing protein 1 [Folsomia candida]|uniref:Sushi, nidogen and EGF-like domain-containing protein 1 n=1 Tax=Folsomia candida TaxID=158441 RepID=A0A226D0W8_FOLCA|nr:sushi, nidogen and EGF-like domain-containing protein 1 [Folsomia candida]OXA38301.1 Sushi, nidogen and EGF-like domain-containing protein 1 [Folsomia candida]
MWSDFATNVFHVLLRVGLHQYQPNGQLGQYSSNPTGQIHYTPVIVPRDVVAKLPSLSPEDYGEERRHTHVLHEGSSGLPLGSLIPFGLGKGDAILAKVDDAFAPIALTKGDPFTFSNVTYSSLFLNTNGGISFKKGIATYIPSCSPAPVPMITPFWADPDTSLGGNITYREAADSATLGKVDAFLQKGFPGQTTGLKWAFIMTMADLPFCHAGAPTDSCPGLALRNTFQTVLARGKTESYVIFLYKKIQWTAAPTYAYGDGGDACTGLGGKHPPVAGFDAADGKTRFQLPTSCSNDALKIASTTNINLPGAWVFRVTSGAVTPCDVQCLHNGDLLADPYDCMSYYQCSNGTPIKHVCPFYKPGERLVFNPFKQVCVWKGEYACEPICTKN